MAETNIIQEYNQNIETEHNINSPKEKSLVKNRRIINHNKNNFPKGPFMLTPLQGMIINKHMPFGFKFEAEENINQMEDSFLTSSKRIKRTNKIYDFSYEQNYLHRKKKYEKKNNRRKNKLMCDSSDNYINHTFQELCKISKICK